MAYFRHAAWSQFFDISQVPYTAEELGLNNYPLIEWIQFIDAVTDVVEVSFSPADYRNADDEMKIQYLLEAFRAVRPRGSDPDWMAQGTICLQQMELAMENPYMMYTGVPGKTSELGDLAYYSLILLRDIGRQTSLERYKNSFHAYAKRPMEIEQLANLFKKITGTFPGGKGIIEMQETELPRILAFFTSEDDFGPAVEQSITRNMATSIEMATSFAVPVEKPKKTKTGTGPKTRASTSKDGESTPKRARTASGSSSDVSIEEE